MKRKLAYFLLLFFVPLTTIFANELPNSKEAQKLFTKVFDMVYGPQGSTLHYSVNIIGIYKTEGTIYYKGKKFQYQEERYSSWQDGTNAFMVDGKKKTVNIYNFNDEKKDTYLSKFKFDPKDYIFSYSKEGNYYLLNAKVRNSKFFGIKELTAKVYQANLYPVSLSIKLGFIKTKVKITNFHSGNILDSQFIFPKNKFTNYTFTDHRNEK